MFGSRMSTDLLKKDWLLLLLSPPFLTATLLYLFMLDLVFLLAISW